MHVMMKMRLKFHQNRTINEELDSFEGGQRGPQGVRLERAPIHKFLS